MKKGQAGFTLVQMMIAGSILSALFLGTMQLSDLFSKNKITESFNVNLLDAADYVGKSLSDPYVCTATLNNPRISIGSVTKGVIDPSNSGLFTTVWNAVMHPVAGPTDPLFILQGSPLVEVSKEVRPGILVKSMNLLTDGDKFFIRVGFAPTEAIEKSKLGGKTINKDYFLTGRRDATGKFFDFCNLQLVDADMRQNCLALRGTWDNEARKCFMADLIDKRELVPVWKEPDGTLTFDAPAKDVKGSFSCQCSTMPCETAPDPCDCILPHCSTLPGCTLESCYYGEETSFEQSDMCMYSRVCVTVTVPPRGYMVRKKQ